IPGARAGIEYPFAGTTDGAPVAERRVAPPGGKRTRRRRVRFRPHNGSSPTGRATSLFNPMRIFGTSGLAAPAKRPTLRWSARLPIAGLLKCVCRLDQGGFLEVPADQH